VCSMAWPCGATFQICWTTCKVCRCFLHNSSHFVHHAFLCLFAVSAMQVALAPLSAHQLFTAISVLQDSPVLELTELLSQIRQGQKELSASEQKSARGQLLQYVPCYVVQHWGKSEVVSTTGAAAERYWLAMIAAQSAAAKEKMAATRQTAGGSRPGAGRPAKKETFPGIAPCLEEFAAGHDYQADRRRRSHETRAEGFRLVDALHHLYENFPELYEAGMSKDTVARIFTAPRKKTVAGGKYYAAVCACGPHNQQCQIGERSHAFCQNAAKATPGVARIPRATLCLR